MNRRHLAASGGALVILLLLGTVVWLIRPGSAGREDRYYVPGVTPSREDCVIAKMKNYNRIDRLVMQAIATECELTVQSIEGHETLRKAWEARQAVREAAPKPAAPAPVAEPAPPEGDRVRRVWR